VENAVGYEIHQLIVLTPELAALAEINKAKFLRNARLYFNDSPPFSIDHFKFTLILVLAGSKISTSGT